MSKKIPFGFVGGTYVAPSPIIDDEIAMNCYVEISESEGAATRKALLGTPGRKLFATLPEAKVPGTLTINGRTFFAVSNLYEVNAGGGVTNWGSLGAAPLTPTMLASNETQLVVLNNGNLYVFTFATNTLIAVNMAQFNGPVAQIGQADGYILATLQNSHTWQQSNLEDATTWSGLNIATISYFSDNIVSMICDHRTFIVWSGKRIIGYYNAGAGFPVFIPIQDALIEEGSGATFATVQADNAVFYLSQDERGFMMAKKLAGLSSSERVSTHAMELKWQQFAQTSDAVGWSYQENGHTFVAFYFPTANATSVWDISQELWHERGFWSTPDAKYIADRAMCHTFNFRKHLVGDWASGKIYELSSKYFTDDGNPIRGNRRSPTISKNNDWLFYGSIEFIMETGLVPQVPILDGEGNPRPAQLMLKWSNNGGKTWSNTYFLSVGLPGDFDIRVIKRMLGRARKRLWDVSWTDPIPWRFNDAVVEAEAEA